MSPLPLEPLRRWLPGPRAWTVIGVLVVIGLALVGLRMWRFQSAADAQQLEFYVYGKDRVAAGEPARFRVVVRDGARQVPLPGATVSATLRRHIGAAPPVPFPAVQTDHEGLAQLAVVTPTDLPSGVYELHVHVSRGSDRAATELLVVADGRASAGKAAVVTDKPRYQPGQTIHMRSLWLGGDQRPQADTEVQFEVLDPRGNAVHREGVKTSAFGIAAVDFELADPVSLGDYTISVSGGAVQAKRTVHIASYALPRFKVTVEPDREAYETGGVITGKVTARYTFGQPVVGAQVRMLAVAQAGQERQLDSGSTDQQGGYRFEVRGGPDRSVTALVAEVSGEGIGRQRGSAELAVLSSPNAPTGPLRIAVVPATPELVRGVPNTLYVVASYADGRPARALVKLHGDVSGERLTSPHGVAKFTVVPDHVDTLLQLTALATDQDGQWGKQTARLQVSSDDAAFLVQTDRATYEPGQSVQVHVVAPYPGPVHLDLERRGRIVGGGTVAVRDGRGVTSLPFPTTGDGPLVLNAYRVMSHGRLFEQSLLRHVQGRPPLSVALSFPEPSYRPGEPAPLSLQVTGPGGAPVQAAVSLAGIDDAVVRDYDRPPGGELADLAPSVQAHGIELGRAVPSLLDSLRNQTPNPDLADAQLAVLAAAELKRGERHWRGHQRREYRSRTMVRQGPLSYVRSSDHLSDLRKTRRVALEGVAGFGTGLFLVLVVLLAIYVVKIPRLGTPTALTHGARRRLARWSLTQLLGWGASTAALGALFAAAFERSASWVLLLTWALVVAAVCWALARCARLVGRSLAVEAFPTWRSLAWTLVGCHLTLHAAALAWAQTARRDELLLALAILALGATVMTGLLAVWRRNALSPRGVLRGWDALGASILLVVAALGAATWSFHQVEVRFPDPSELDDGDETEQVAEEDADNKEGGTGTRAKGEEGSMGNPNAPLQGVRYGVRGPADSSEPGGGGSPPRMREHFPETLLWMPEVITDPAGRSVVEVPLADSITTWQLSATAVSAAGLVGASTTGLRAFQEFFVDLELPRHLTVGDEIAVPVVVFNYLPKPQAVRLKLVPSAEIEVLGDGQAELQIAPESSRAATFEIRARGQGEGFVAVEARGDQLADAIKRPVKVHHDLHRLVQVFGGRIDGTEEIAFEVPDTTVEGTAEATLKLYPGAFAQIAEGLRGVFQRPHGCFEQTSSTTYPSVLALQFLRSLRKTSPALEKEALGYLHEGYQRLLTFEVPGGGFSLFGDSPAEAVMTAYGLMQFADMKQVRFVDPKLIERTRDWLLTAEGGKWSRQPTPLPVTAYIAWALSEAGARGPTLDGALRRLAEAPLDRTEAPYDLALCANALLAANRTAQARPVLERLIELRRPQEAYWRASGRSVLYASGRAGDEETTALAALALLRGHLRREVADAALLWLVEQRGQHGTWSATSSTVAAMRALLAGTSGGSGALEAVTIAVNGAALPAPPKQAAGTLAHVTIPLTDQLQVGTNQIALSARDDGHLRYQLVSSRWLRWEDAPGDNPTSPFSYQVKYSPVRLAPGESLRCEVTLRWKREDPIKMPMVEVGIPPGTQVVRDDLEQLKRDGRIESYGIGPRHLVLYLPELAESAGLSFGLRAHQRGRVKAPPSRAYPYYEPELVVETRPRSITIE